MIVFITATNTNVGKTYITQKIARLLDSKINIAISKPIETGVIDIPQDAKKHAEFQGKKISDICFYQFSLPSAPFIADENNIIDIDFLIKKLRALESSCDILLVEGAGGLFVPIKKDYFMIDFIADLGAFSLIVGDSALGCINNILSAREILKSRNLNFISVINVFDMRDFENISCKFFKDKNLDKNFISPTDDAQIAEFLISLLKN